jgi:hypothetical protein
MFKIGIIFLVLLIYSCGGPKKCNGSKGTRVDMGTM